MLGRQLFHWPSTQQQSSISQLARPLGLSRQLPLSSAEMHNRQINIPAINVLESHSRFESPRFGAEDEKHDEDFSVMPRTFNSQTLQKNKIWSSSSNQSIHNDIRRRLDQLNHPMANNQYSTREHLGSGLLSSSAISTSSESIVEHDWFGDSGRLQEKGSSVKKGNQENEGETVQNEELVLELKAIRSMVSTLMRLSPQEEKAAESREAHQAAIGESTDNNVKAECAHRVSKREVQMPPDKERAKAIIDEKEAPRGVKRPEKLKIKLNQNSETDKVRHGKGVSFPKQISRRTIASYSTSLSTNEDDKEEATDFDDEQQKTINTLRMENIKMKKEIKRLGKEYSTQTTLLINNLTSLKVEQSQYQNLLDAQEKHLKSTHAALDR